MLPHGLGELSLQLGREWHGAQGTQRVEGLLHMVVMVDMRVRVMVVVMVRLRACFCLWLRVGTGLWYRYGAEWVRLERRASCSRRGSRYARDWRGRCRGRGGMRQFS